MRQAALFASVAAMAAALLTDATVAGQQPGRPKKAARVCVDKRVEPGWLVHPRLPRLLVTSGPGF